MCWGGRDLEKVAGVSKVEVNYNSKSAVVTFDDDVVKISDLTQATEGAGFPSKAVERN